MWGKCEISQDGRQMLEHMKKVAEEYTHRLAEETQIILQLRFVDYFIQICDIIAMTRDIPHMTRGSAGSSLVCYLLGA